MPCVLSGLQDFELHSNRITDTRFDYLVVQHKYEVQVVTQ